MELNTSEYQGKDRRGNGKLKLTTGDWIRISCIVVPLIAGVDVRRINRPYKEWMMEVVR